MSMEQPEFIMIAGCNGAGKSTFIRSRLNQLEHFKVLMTDVYKGRTKELARAAIVQRNNIIIETVFNDQSFKELADEARLAGYKTFLIVLFLDELNESLSRVAFRSIQQSGINISRCNIKINFNESFRNITDYFFYFDRSDFIYTGAGQANLPVMTFLKSKIAGYFKNDFDYVKKIAEYGFRNGRLNEEAYQIIKLNNNLQSDAEALPASTIKF